MGLIGQFIPHSADVVDKFTAKKQRSDIARNSFMAIMSAFGMDALQDDEANRQQDQEAETAVVLIVLLGAALIIGALLWWAQKNT